MPKERIANPVKLRIIVIMKASSSWDKNQDPGQKTSTDRMSQKLSYVTIIS